MLKLLEFYWMEHFKCMEWSVIAIYIQFSAFIWVQWIVKWWLHCILFVFGKTLARTPSSLLCTPLTFPRLNFVSIHFYVQSVWDNRTTITSSKLCLKSVCKNSIDKKGIGNILFVHIVDDLDLDLDAVDASIVFRMGLKHQQQHTISVSIQAT